MKNFVRTQTVIRLLREMGCSISISEEAEDCDWFQMPAGSFDATEDFDIKPDCPQPVGAMTYPALTRQITDLHTRIDDMKRENAALTVANIKLTDRLNYQAGRIADIYSSIDTDRGDAHDLGDRITELAKLVGDLRLDLNRHTSSLAGHQFVLGRGEQLGISQGQLSAVYKESPNHQAAASPSFGVKQHGHE